MSEIVQVLTSPDEARMVLAAYARERLKDRSVWDWVNACVRIEDANTRRPIPFRLWPDQRKVLETFTTSRLVVVLKARQLGLTWLALAYAVWNMLRQPGYSVAALSRGEKEAQELVRRARFILRNLPFGVFVVPGRRPKWGLPAWEGTTERVWVHHPAGEDSIFDSFPASEDAGRAFTSSLVIIDEWAFQRYAEEIWAAAYPTVNRPDGGQVIGISTGRRGTFFAEIWDAAVKGENSFIPVFLPWYADPRRTSEWYEQTKRDLPNTYMAEYPATPTEAFSAGSDTVFLEFSRDIHVVKPFELPPWWRRWLANDPGYADHFAWYWFAADQDGNVYVYREYTNADGERVPYSEQAAKVVELSEGEQLDFCVTGMDAWNRHPETGKSIIDYYREGGLDVGFIQPVHGPQSRRLRTAVTHEY
ncbi:MAG: terminase large subunit domain-containing protein, partial [Anaerolineae bacterium]